MVGMQTVRGCVGKLGGVVFEAAHWSAVKLSSVNSIGSPKILVLKTILPYSPPRLVEGSTPDKMGSGGEGMDEDNLRHPRLDHLLD